VPIIDKPNINTAIRAWQGHIPLESLYTVGVAGEKFFRALKDEGKLLATYCPVCDYTYVPGRLFCERCFTQLDDWREVGPEGTLHSFTVLHVGLDGTPLKRPQLLATVQLDGADSCLVHFLGGVEPEEVYIGMAVRAVLRPPQKRQGGILDIAYFRPV